MPSLNVWLDWLRRGDVVVSAPLLVVGAILMLFGWRMWRFCVSLSYGLIGAWFGATYGGEGQTRWLAAGACAIVLGVASYWPAKHAVAGLGGVIGTAIAVYLMKSLNLRGMPVALLAVVAFLMSSALAYSNKRLVAIGLTAVIGATLCISGIIALIMISPSLYGTFSALTTKNILVAVFIFMVPAVMSCFYQMGEVRRVGMDL